VKIGVFGGAFDPPHVGHLIIAEGVRAAFDLDRILFIPYTTGPHRPQGPSVSAIDRLQMLQLSTADNEYLEIDDLELRRGGISFTIDTLRTLAETRAGDEFVLIIGSDQLQEFSDWKEWKNILDMVEVAVVARPGFDLESGPDELTEKMIPVSLPLLLISSSMIRERISNGLSIRYLVQPAVAGYIEKQGLYLDDAGKEEG
jgi:nicotinate-nucleotide adenylyltransferase